jgi:hypothetical protein
MKRIIPLAAVALLLVMLLTACEKPHENVPFQTESSTPAEPSKLAIDGIEWLVEPSFEYDYIYYCEGCGWSSDKGIIDENTGQPLYEHPGHGGWSEEFYYDEEENIVGYSTYAPGVSTYTTYSTEEFPTQFPKYANTLNLFAGYDSTKVEIKVSEIAEDFTEHNIDETLSGKCAVALGEKFFTAFEFEDGERFARRKFNNIIAVKKDGKWGVIDKDGKTAAPFVFEDAISIDDTTAFAKYEGKWGIIKVK